MTNKYVAVSGVVFGLVAVAHIVRAVGEVPVQLGGSEIPIWASWLGALVSGALCIWAFRSQK